MKIHKKKYRFKPGTWCKCNRPLYITHRWDRVTCPKCLEFSPGKILPKYRRKRGEAQNNV